MNNGFWKKGSLFVAGVFLSHMFFTTAAFSPLLQAQPDLKEMPSSEKRGEQDRFNRPKRGPNRGEQRRKSEEGIRQMLAQSGLEDAVLQDTVLEYVREDLEARKPLREQGAKLLRVLRDGTLTEEQLSALVADYRTAQLEEKVRQENAQKMLDEKINFSKNPRLEAMLLLSGLIGESSGNSMLMRRGPGAGRGAGPGAGTGAERGRMREGENANPEERRQRFLERFDKNKDGKLDEEETAAMRKQLDNQRPNRPTRMNSLPGDA